MDCLGGSRDGYKNGATDEMEMDKERRGLVSISSRALNGGK